MRNKRRQQGKARSAMAIPALALTTLTLLVVNDAKEQNSDPAPGIGRRIQARGPLDALESYPAGYLLRPGALIATIQPGEEYEVIGSKRIPSILFGNSYYIRIWPTDDTEHPCRTHACWVYHGRSRKGPPWNLQTTEASASNDANRENRE